MDRNNYKIGFLKKKYASFNITKLRLFSNTKDDI